MDINFNFHGCDPRPPLAEQLASIASDIATLKGLAMATKAEFAASLDQITAHVAKVGMSELKDAGLLVRAWRWLVAPMGQATAMSPRQVAGGWAFPPGCRFELLPDPVGAVTDETRTLIARVADLTAAVEAAGNSSPEMDAALEALKAQVAVVDELVPDAGA